MNTKSVSRVSRNSLAEWYKQTTISSSLSTYYEICLNYIVCNHEFSYLRWQFCGNDNTSFSLKKVCHTTLLGILLSTSLSTQSIQDRVSHCPIHHTLNSQVKTIHLYWHLPTHYYLTVIFVTFTHFYTLKFVIE